MTAVYCAACGAVVGVSEYSNVPTLIRTLASKLGFKLD
jgi:Fe2+ or Zn2+ uptake regulation protein